MKQTKSNHQTGYHKPVTNATTNYPMDSHKAFCKRCVKYNGGVCPATGTAQVYKNCDI